MDAPVVSIVAPAYNEARNLAAFIQAITPVLDGLGETWEIVFVDDGSRDDTLGLLLAARAQDSRRATDAVAGMTMPDAERRSPSAPSSRTSTRSCSRRIGRPGSEASVTWLNYPPDLRWLPCGGLRLR